MVESQLVTLNVMGSNPIFFEYKMYRSLVSEPVLGIGFHVFESHHFDLQIRKNADD